MTKGIEVVVTRFRLCKGVRVPDVPYLNISNSPASRSVAQHLTTLYRSHSLGNMSAVELSQTKYATRRKNLLSVINQLRAGG